MTINMVMYLKLKSGADSLGVEPMYAFSFYCKQLTIKFRTALCSCVSNRAFGTVLL